MELVALWAVAGAMALSALIFGWVTITAHPRAAVVERRSQPARRDDLVRRACANLDEEYRQLLRH